MWRNFYEFCMFNIIKPGENGLSLYNQESFCCRVACICQNACFCSVIITIILFNWIVAFFSCLPCSVIVYFVQLNSFIFQLSSLSIHMFNEVIACLKVISRSPWMVLVFACDRSSWMVLIFACLLSYYILNLFQQPNHFRSFMFMHWRL